MPWQKLCCSSSLWMYMPQFRIQQTIYSIINKILIYRELFPEACALRKKHALFSFSHHFPYKAQNGHDTGLLHLTPQHVRQHLQGSRPCRSTARVASDQAAHSATVTSKRPEEKEKAVHQCVLVAWKARKAWNSTCLKSYQSLVL